MAKFKQFWGAHGSTVLTIISLVANIAAPILSAIATPKALEAIEEEDTRRFDEFINSVDPANPEAQKKYAGLTAKDKFLIGAKYYIPAAACTVVGGTCQIFAHAKDAKTISSMASAYNALSLSTQVFEKVVAESVPEQKYAEIRAKRDAELPEQAVSKKEEKVYRKLEENVSHGDEILDGRYGWFLDTFTGQKWWATIEMIDSAINEVNNHLNNGDFISIAEYLCYCQSKGVQGVTIVDYDYQRGFLRDANGDILRRYIDMPKADTNGIAYAPINYNLKPRYMNKIWD